MLGQLASNRCYKWWVEVSEFKAAGFRREQLNREKGSNFPIRNSRRSFHLHPPIEKRLYQISSQSSASIIWAFRVLSAWTGHTGNGLHLTLGARRRVPILLQSRCRTRREGGQAHAHWMYSHPCTPCKLFSVEAVSLFWGVCLAVAVFIIIIVLDSQFEG